MHLNCEPECIVEFYGVFKQFCMDAVHETMSVTHVGVLARVYTVLENSLKVLEFCF